MGIKPMSLTHKGATLCLGLTHVRTLTREVMPRSCCYRNWRAYRAPNAGIAPEVFYRIVANYRYALSLMPVSIPATS